MAHRVAVPWLSCLLLACSPRSFSEVHAQNKQARIFAHSGYPFTHDDLNPRQDAILGALRDHLRLAVYEETLTPGLLEPWLGEVRLRNMEGQMFAGSLAQPKPKTPFVPREQVHFGLRGTCTRGRSACLHLCTSSFLPPHLLVFASPAAGADRRQAAVEDAHR